MKKTRPTSPHDHLAEIIAVRASQAVCAVVPDPYSDAGGTITVQRATRDDPLAGMLARKQIDRAQFEAGRRWQELWEAAEIGAVKAIDPTKEPVDGTGPARSPFSDRQKKAFEELNVAMTMLGYEGHQIVHSVLGLRMQLVDVASQRGRPAKYIGQRFRETLETLAKLWGFA